MPLVPETLTKRNLKQIDTIELHPLVARSCLCKRGPALIVNIYRR